MAHRIIDLLETVEIEHHDRTAAVGGLECGEHRGEPAVHPVTVGKPGQRVEFCGARIFQFPPIFNRYVFGIAAIAVKFPRIIEFRVTGDQPPRRTILAAERLRNPADNEIGDLAALAEVIFERAIGILVRIVGIIFKQAGQRNSEQIADRLVQIFRRFFR